MMKNVVSETLNRNSSAVWGKLRDWKTLKRICYIWIDAKKPDPP